MNHRPISRGCDSHLSDGFQADCQHCQIVKVADDAARKKYLDEQAEANQEINDSENTPNWVSIGLVAIGVIVAFFGFGSCFATADVMDGPDKKKSAPVHSSRPALQSGLAPMGR